jgi:hypothetical protein
MLLAGYARLCLDYSLLTVGWREVMKVTRKKQMTGDTWTPRVHPLALSIPASTFQNATSD